MQEFHIHKNTPNGIAQYPMVPIRGVVVFPYTDASFVIGRPSSVRALEKALATNRIIFLATQHDETVDVPTPDQIYQVGTLAYISDSLRKTGEATIKIMLKGRERAQSVRFEERDGYYLATLARAPIVAEDNDVMAPVVSRIVSLISRSPSLSGTTLCAYPYLVISTSLRDCL